MTNLSLNAVFFSESFSRFIVTISEESREEFETVFNTDVTLLGQVTNERQLHIIFNGTSIINLSCENLIEAWKNGLVF